MATMANGTTARNGPLRVQPHCVEACWPSTHELVTMLDCEGSGLLALLPPTRPDVDWR
jgi:hypothetical protein